MVERFETSQWVAYPVELVFAFFANPANLPHLMPPGRKVRMDGARLKPPPSRPVAADPARRFASIAAGVGSEILISFQPLRWIPKRLKWLARITEFEWNRYFCDEQAEGPFVTFRHCHEMEAERRDGEEGTRVTDRIAFELPFRAAGRIGDLLAQRAMAKLFAFRQKRLPEILTVAARQAARRS